MGIPWGGWGSCGACSLSFAFQFILFTCAGRGAGADGDSVACRLSFAFRSLLVALMIHVICFLPGASCPEDGLCAQEIPGRGICA